MVANVPKCEEVGGVGWLEVGIKKATERSPFLLLDCHGIFLRCAICTILNN